MNVIKYYCLFQEAIGNGSQMSVYINSKTSVHLLAPNFLMFVYFSLIHFTQTSNFLKLRKSRIPSDTSLWIIYLETWPKYLCHNITEFPFNLSFVPHDLENRTLLDEACESSMYRLLIKELVPISLEFWKRQTLLFPK